MRLLLAEDNPVNAELFVAAVTSEGYDVTIAQDGQAAQERALAESFDVIVLDIQMPKLDGWAVCRALRAAGIQQPIVALSAFAMPTDVRRAQDAGFDAYLTKPISPTGLRDNLRRLTLPPS